MELVHFINVNRITLGWLIQTRMKWFIRSNASYCNSDSLQKEKYNWVIDCNFKFKEIGLIKFQINDIRYILILLKKDEKYITSFS